MVDDNGRSETGENPGVGKPVGLEGGKKRRSKRTPRSEGMITQKVMMLARSADKIDAVWLVRTMNISMNTACVTLNRLTKRGKLKREGDRRKYTYTLP